MSTAQAMNEIVSYETFRWIITVLTGGLASTWVVYDSLNLYRSRNLDRRDPLVHDKRFGYVMGILIGIVGVIGCLRYHDLL